GDAVEIIIADSGHGISPEDKERLFLPHFSTKERGTGLGLAIASRIIAEHNGTIRVEDNLPTGTTFVIRFPAAVVVAAPAQTGTPLAELISYWQGPKLKMPPTILIVDGELGIRESLGALLRDEGYEIAAVDSGEACLEILEQRKFDLILLDVWLKKLDGL